MIPFRNIVRARDYYGHAGQFTSAYVTLSRASADAGQAGVAKDLDLASVKLLLLGHALELVMKGWLILHEGTPKELSREQKRALMAAGATVPLTLRDYSHDLEQLAAATVKYYPPLQEMIDNRHIAHLNSSYWGKGARDYEYPEGNHFSAILTPLDGLGTFIETMRQSLIQAILAENGGQPI